jgi:hypothetical protein
VLRIGDPRSVPAARRFLVVMHLFFHNARLSINPAIHSEFFGYWLSAIGYAPRHPPRFMVPALHPRQRLKPFQETQLYGFERVRPGFQQLTTHLRAIPLN